MERNEVSASAILNAIIQAILDSGSKLVIDGSFYKEVGLLVADPAVPYPSIRDLLISEASAGKRKLLDFGCGAGSYRALCEEIGFSWTGLNYEEGMALGARDKAHNQNNIYFYDGKNIPADNDEYDTVFSMQVFEHLDDINGTFMELYRILRIGGGIIGSVSQLEQMHDFSTYNFTPYGLKIACQKAGLTLERVYPRLDVFTFLLRRLLIVTSGNNENSFSGALKENSEIVKLLYDYGKRIKSDDTRIALLQLMFSSHFSFKIRKLK